ncbi:AIPR family protein [Catellatospora methionotrophica]|nr:AIPR family protein [Catellatospora methionotrophica]
MATTVVRNSMSQLRKGHVVTIEAARQVTVMAEALKRDFADLIDISDFTHPDLGERRRKFLTRALGALVVRDYVGCDARAAADFVVDGGQDFGIDALAISEGAPRLWLIQTKWSDKGEAKLGELEVMTMVDGLRKIDQFDFARFNPRFQQHAERVKTVLSDRRARITLVLALMRKDELHENVTQRLEDVRREFNAYGEHLDVKVLYGRDLWEMMRRSSQPDPIDLALIMDRWFQLETPMRAIVGVVSAAEVADWHTTHGDRLFSKNIRESLGLTHVNAGLVRTLTEDPHDFWYYNNGITVLCDDLDVKLRSKGLPSGPVDLKITGASVVNGAQTVAAVARAVNQEETAGYAFVNVRIIETSDTAVGSQITKATNTQNHVERRDFVALDPIQAQIKDEFAAALGLTYSIRRSELEPPAESGCSVRVAAVALASAHPSAELAVRARVAEDLLWEDGPKGAYRLLFGSKPSAIQIWRSVQLLRSVLESLHAGQASREGRAAAVAEHGNLLVAHLVFQRIGRDGVDDPDFDWNDVLGQVPGLVDVALQWLIHAVDEIIGANKLIGATFSNPERVRSLVQFALQKLDEGASVPELPDSYRVLPKQRTRRASSVQILVDARMIKDGTTLKFGADTAPERAALADWLSADPRRETATWVNDRTKPLLWAVDAKRYSPSGLVMRMWALAEWAEASVAVQGTKRWSVPGEGTLVEMAEAVLRAGELPLAGEELL